MRDELYYGIVTGAFGLSIGMLWKNVNRMCHVSYPKRVEYFFLVLERSINQGHVKLGRNGRLLNYSVEGQLNLIKQAWPVSLSEEENLGRDDLTLRFMVHAPAEIVWITADGKEIWS